MEETRFQEIENRTQVWGFGTQQDFAALIKKLSRENISADEFLEYVEIKKEEKRKSEVEFQKLKALQREQVEEMKKKAKKCPDCGQPLNLGKIVDDPHGNKHQWYCLNQDGCSWIDERGPETVEEVYKQIGIDMTKYQELSW